MKLVFILTVVMHLADGKTHMVQQGYDTPDQCISAMQVIVQQDDAIKEGISVQAFCSQHVVKKEEPI